MFDDFSIEWETFDLFTNSIKCVMSYWIDRFRYLSRLVLMSRLLESLLLVSLCDFIIIAWNIKVWFILSFLKFRSLC